MARLKRLPRPGWKLHFISSKLIYILERLVYWQHTIELEIEADDRLQADRPFRWQPHPRTKILRVVVIGRDINDKMKRHPVGRIHKTYF